ncbi:MAG: hypothetical protein ACK4MG_00430 [Aquabacterium sp.]
MMRRLVWVPALRWQEALDFAAPRRRTSVWGWALLGLALLMVAMVSEDAARVDQARRDGADEVQRLERAVRQATRTPGQSTSGPLSLSQAKQAQAPAIPVLQKADWRHAAEMAEVLGHDSVGLLDRVDRQASAMHVVLTGLRFTLERQAAGGERAGVMLQAAVPDDRTALAWVDSLGPQARLHSRQRLSAPLSDGVREHRWRVDVSWAEAQP